MNEKHSAAAAGLIRIPGTRLLLNSSDFFFDCVPVAASSILEIGLGILALAAAGFCSPSQIWLIRLVASPSTPPSSNRGAKKDVKRNLDMDLVSMTGVQMSSRNMVFRKLSDENVRVRDIV